MKTKKKGLCIELTQGQYDHLYNIMCSQDEIIDYLNESDDFDPQTFYGGSVLWEDFANEN